MVVQTFTVNDVIETADVAAPMLPRQTYIADAGDIMNNTVSVNESAKAGAKTSASASGVMTKSKTYELRDPYYYALQLFMDST